MFRSWPSLILCAALVAAPTLAAADAPKVGQPWMPPTFKTWLDGAPVAADAAGKVVIHWFCKPDNEDCGVDLARLYHLRQQGNVYIIAYIGGSKGQAKRLDPVRSEIGAGAVAFGPTVAKIMAREGLSAPMSVVIGTDGKVAHIAIGGEPDTLDDRDKKISTLTSAIREFTAEASVPPVVKPGERFELKLEIALASWLTSDSGVKPTIQLTVPPDVTCEATEMKDVAISPRKLTAKVGCKAKGKGSYEARAAFRFSYRTPGKGIGVARDDVRFKFQVK